MRFILFLAVAISIVTAATAQSAEDRLVAMSEITAMVRDELPGSYNLLVYKVRGRVSVEQLQFPVIDYTRFVSEFTQQLIDYMKNHPGGFGIEEERISSADFRQQMSEKFAYRIALNMIDDQSQLFFDLEKSGGTLSDCSSPQSVVHRKGARIAICLDTLEGNVARLKLLINDKARAIWKLEDIHGRWRLFGIETEINHDLVRLLMIIRR